MAIALRIFQYSLFSLIFCWFYSLDSVFDSHSNQLILINMWFFSLSSSCFVSLLDLIKQSNFFYLQLRFDILYAWTCCCNLNVFNFNFIVVDAGEVMEGWLFHTWEHNYLLICIFFHSFSHYYCIKNNTFFHHHCANSKSLCDKIAVKITIN